MARVDLHHLPERAVVVHGGMHKTGSSAIQNTLAAERGRLAEQGWLYPRAGCVMQEATGNRHRKLMTELRKKEGSPSWAQLRREIRDWPGRVLISHENFFSPQIDPLDIEAELPGREVYLLAYLRHPVDYIESCYREWVRRWKFSGSPREYYAKRQDYLDIQTQALAWENAFGEDHLLLRPYHRAQFQGGTVLTDFLSVLGLDDSLASVPTFGNDSLNSAQVMVHLVANELRASPHKRDTLAQMLADAQIADQTLGQLSQPIDGVEAVQPEKLQALRDVLQAANAPGRILDDSLVGEIAQRHLGNFLATLSRHGSAELGASSYAALPCDARFFAPSIRSSVQQLLA
jgi:hypothetical protein